MNYTQHPLSSAFPPMPADEFAGLVDDIRKHGQRDVATLADGMVIDGWHRYQACEQLGIPCRFEQFAGEDAVAFVRSKNQFRRHYQKSQQAAIEVALSDWADAHRPKKEETVSSFSTNQEMADRAGTTVRTIRDAKRAHEAGLGDAVRDGKISAHSAAQLAAKDPDLTAAVARGEVSLPAAVKQVSPPKPVPAPPPPEDPERSELDELRDQLAEMTAMCDELRADNESMAKVFESNEQLAEALAEAKKYREQLRIAESRITGLMNEKNEQIRRIRGMQRTIDKLEKASGSSIAA